MLEIESREIQTIDDEISGEFCNCGHEISEHFMGEITGTSKCNALINNGAIWSSCNCTKLRERQFSISVMVTENANNSQNRITT